MESILKVRFTEKIEIHVYDCGFLLYLVVLESFFAEINENQNHFHFLVLWQQTFGYSQFRPAQKEVVLKVLEGVDCLVVMATGSGKSLWICLDGWREAVREQSPRGLRSEVGRRGWRQSLTVAFSEEMQGANAFACARPFVFLPCGGVCSRIGALMRK
ncbi:hypothetical protein KSP39_PZI008813 [Platanthera zijinensis]|uniref:DEAD/DEAH box helicase domain-containing protein n=1 Tax=Platanthera zijinensis TaxID=2320716 RepID=A0AAP0BJT9_9ASPA